MSAQQSKPAPWTPGSKFARRSKMKEVIDTSRKLAETQGIRVAARYLQAKNWTFEGAHYILLGYYPRELRADRPCLSQKQIERIQQ